MIQRQQRKGPPVRQDPTGCIGATSVEGLTRTEEISSFGRKSEVKHSETLSTSCWTNDKQGRKSGKKVETNAIKDPMTTIDVVSTIHQANPSESRRSLYAVDLDKLPDSRERTGAPVRLLLRKTS